MDLVQVLVPIEDEDGRAYPRRVHDDLLARLTETFGGVTAYTRAPATGLWEDDSGKRVRDQVVVYEVMVERLDPGWWKDFRAELEAKLGQEELVVRAQTMRRL